MMEGHSKSSITPLFQREGWGGGGGVRGGEGGGGAVAIVTVRIQMRSHLDLLFVKVYVLVCRDERGKEHKNIQSSNGRVLSQQ